MIKIPVRRIQNVAQLAGIGCEQSQVHHSLSNSFLGRVVDVESFNGWSVGSIRMIRWVPLGDDNQQKMTLMNCPEFANHLPD